MSRIAGLAGLVGLLLPGWHALRAQTPVAVGQEFQVNTFTTSAQKVPAIAVAPASGDFVVVWTSDGSASDPASYSVQGQVFDAASTPLGGQFEVDTYTSGRETNPGVAADAAGNFLVTWESAGSFGSDTSTYSIQGQRLDASGAAVGAQFQVNDYTSGSQVLSSVAIDADTGEFLVSWESYGSPGTDLSQFSIQSRRFDPDASPLGAQFQVNTYTLLNQFHPKVAWNPRSSSFLVVWDSHGSLGGDNSSYSVQGQRFDALGSPLGGEFQINTTTEEDQDNPVVAVDPASGDFVVVWSQYYGVQLKGQRLDSTGSPVGSEFRVDSEPATENSGASVAIDPRSGDFFVVWQSLRHAGDDTSARSVQGQRFAADATPLGAQFLVNSYTTGNQYQARVATKPDGGFVVVWASAGSAGTDQDGLSVLGRVFQVSLLVDGFETGDTSRWSLTVP